MSSYHDFVFKRLSRREQARYYYAKKKLRFNFYDCVEYAAPDAFDPQYDVETPAEAFAATDKAVDNYYDSLLSNDNVLSQVARNAEREYRVARAAEQQAQFRSRHASEIRQAQEEARSRKRYHHSDASETFDEFEKRRRLA